MYQAKIDNTLWVFDENAYELTTDVSGSSIIYVPMDSLDDYITINDSSLNIQPYNYKAIHASKQVWSDYWQIICTSTSNPELMRLLYDSSLCEHEDYMTLAEAKSITSIPDILNGLTNASTYQVETFNEFQYFTGITSIPDHFASNNSYLREITLPLSVTSIEQAAFALTSQGISAGKTNVLTKVEGVENVTSLDAGVFQKAYYLQHLNFTNKLTTLTGAAVFRECYNLERVGDMSNVTSLGSGSTFMQCYKLKEINLSNKITSLPNSAFRECSNLETVGDLTEVTTMGNTVFYKMNKLKKLNLPKITALEQTAIFKLDELIELNIPNVTRLKNQGAIGDIPLIKKIDFPVLNKIDKAYCIAFSAVGDDHLEIEINFGLPYSEISFASKSILCDPHHTLHITFNGEPATQEQLDYIISWQLDE